jgi:hypothetical protein
VGAHQRLDAGGRLVEAPGEPGHLVVPFHPNPGRQMPRAERLDARLQTLQPGGQPSHHRIGADADGDGE